MGVKGLWSLLNPVARPVQIESMEGKRLAIDSSIWLYQFQATMRDKDGRVLVNAHVLGFLRRINKLLFHGIKPVFVFDGGAPALKRATIAERKKKKSGAAANHAKVAEKLFAAQMRREAVKAAQAMEEQRAARNAAASAAQYPDEAGEQIAEDVIYLEELENQAGPSRPRPTPIERTSSSSAPIRPSTPVGEVPTDPEKRRKHFKKHDPYRLPEADMPTVSTNEKPDARLATEEELKQFIDEVGPGDIDVESAEFRALPTEVQYEIIGDLRSRSRQQSHRRLTDMLRAAPTALDFSMAQIKHLSQRNALTQQLLTVTDMVGKAHLTIPVRIAAERNREYVLVKKGEDEGGGWVLGIREGTKEKPIAVEDDVKSNNGSESESESDDSDIQEIESPRLAPVDPDLRAHRRREMLEAIARRYAPKRPTKAPLDIAVRPFGASRTETSKPLFDKAVEEEEDDEIVPTANDEALALALQQEELGSDEEEVDEDLARALALSRREIERRERSVTQEADWETKSESGEDEDMEEVELVPSGATTPALETTPRPVDDSDEDEDLEEVLTDSEPSRQVSESAIAAVEDPPIVTARQTVAKTKSAGVAPHRLISPAVIEIDGDEEEEDAPLFLETHRNSRVTIPSHDPLPSSKTAPPVPSRQIPVHSQPSSQTPGSEVFSEFQLIPELQPQTLESTPKSTPLLSPQPIESSPAKGARLAIPSPTSTPPTEVPKANLTLPPTSSPARPQPIQRFPSAIVRPSPLRKVTQPASSPITIDGEVEEEALLAKSPEHLETDRVSPAPTPAIFPLPSKPPVPRRMSLPPPSPRQQPPESSTSPSQTPDEHIPPNPSRPPLFQSVSTEDDASEDDGDADDGRSIEWSKSPSPVPRPALQPTDSSTTIPSEVEDQDGDITTGDMAAEEDDYARFIAQIKGRDLNEVRTEIDDEIRVLNSANKVAMRDSDEITQSMVTQIQTLLRHFGIPYITAPMEAEAQCAKLAELGLVDGIITDDSDVFLFGGTQCFKNIFNDAKYAECFLSTDIERELSLNRDRLISLAYLLGSDYTIGLPGVGPVVALELLANFPGERGIDNFKEWWMKVQRGMDTPQESGTKWRISFKKRYAHTIYLTNDWPNPLVREAYKYPTTDESEEPFHWGFPKLSALRTFLHEELSWSITKVDDELTPIVQRIARRGKMGALNKQGILDPFFDTSVVAGNYAPRRRTTANVSKRLMAVIKSFREAEATVNGNGNGTGEPPKTEWGEMMAGLDEEDPKGRGTGKRRNTGSMSVEGDGNGAGVKKRRLSSASAISRGRKRAGTNASSVSVAESTGSTESSVSVSVSAGAGAGANGRGRGRGRGGKARGRGRGRGGTASASRSASARASHSPDIEPIEVLDD
ncbi:DNA excision repair protein ERCC-5 [Kwoniella heveanensis BCC8398]|uniref:DNA excision repair protein ERCC-5 n=1 Tax=Kwoniella heveanensis BCC8398 TaxID=1296120 RepID=A0A1B9H0J3_9TREE|nr:DNA excision repair protein ERCC-5 [Kwoniella heveanensis BCC8398]